MSNSTMNKREFIKKVADYAGFTIKDTNIFWDAVRSVFEEALENFQEIEIPGFGKLRIITYRERMGYDYLAKQRTMYPPTKGLRFELAPSLRSNFRKLQKRKAQEEQAGNGET